MSFLKAFAVLFVTLAILSPAHADDSMLPLTKDSAAQIIQKKTKGKVLSVDQDQHENKTIFSVKVLHKDGKVKVFRMDSETGKQLKPKAQ